MKKTKPCIATQLSMLLALSSAVFSQDFTFISQVNRGVDVQVSSNGRPISTITVAANARIVRSFDDRSQSYRVVASYSDASSLVEQLQSIGGGNLFEKNDTTGHLCRIIADYLHQSQPFDVSPTARELTISMVDGALCITDNGVPVSGGGQQITYTPAPTRHCAAPPRSSMSDKSLELKMPIPAPTLFQALAVVPMPAPAVVPLQTPAVVQMPAPTSFQALAVLQIPAPVLRHTATFRNSTSESITLTLLTENHTIQPNQTATIGLPVGTPIQCVVTRSSGEPVTSSIQVTNQSHQFVFDGNTLARQSQ